MTSAREVGRFGVAFAIGFVGWLAVVAVWLGVMAYLGENWTTYLTTFLSAASVGFGLILLALGAFTGTKARSD